MRFGVIAFALAAALAVACGGDDDADPTTVAPNETETTATAPADGTTAPGETPTAGNGSGGDETQEPVEFEPTFTCDAPIGVLEARASAGDEVEFSERVYETQERGSDLILSAGAPLSAPLRVELIIVADAMDAFPGPPAPGFANRVICARGTVETVNGVPSIYIQSADQLSVVAD